LQYLGKCAPAHLSWLSVLKLDVFVIIELKNEKNWTVIMKISVQKYTYVHVSCLNIRIWYCMHICLLLLIKLIYVPQSIFNSDQFRNTIEEEIEKWCEEVCVQSCYNNSYRTLFPSLYYLLLTLKYRYLHTYNYYLPISLYVQTISVKHLGFQLPLVMSFFFRGSMYRYLCTFTSIISL